MDEGVARRADSSSSAPRTSARRAPRSLDAEAFYDLRRDVMAGFNARVTDRRGVRVLRLRRRRRAVHLRARHRGRRRRRPRLQRPLDDRGRRDRRVEHARDAGLGRAVHRLRQAAPGRASRARTRRPRAARRRRRAARRRPALAPAAGAADRDRGARRDGMRRPARRRRRLAARRDAARAAAGQGRAAEAPTAPSSTRADAGTHARADRRRPRSRAAGSAPALERATRRSRPPSPPPLRDDPWSLDLRRGRPAAGRRRCR